ncbi:hypothetical protein [Streptomyces sp. CAU 1734]|uniref:hypothetical protein n=1 Tax=Streptomyces sp. CAU 1734 TaxID=3140360 RepID=UPI003261C769
MAKRQWPAAVRGTLFAGLLLLIAACAQPAGGSAPGSSAGAASAGPGYGAVFLGTGDCGSRGRDPREVPCTSEKAVARVTVRRNAGTGEDCPAGTDFVLNISHRHSSADEDGDGDVRQGYACMRNLEPPHPGDPGGGGGPHTVVGDCLRGSGGKDGREVRETACDGSGAHRPEYTVTAAVTNRARCPRPVDLHVQLRGSQGKTGCARRL